MPRTVAPATPENAGRSTNGYSRRARATRTPTAPSTRTTTGAASSTTVRTRSRAVARAGRPGSSAYSSAPAAQDSSRTCTGGTAVWGPTGRSRRTSAPSGGRRRYTSQRGRPTAPRKKNKIAAAPLKPPIDYLSNTRNSGVTNKPPQKQSHQSITETRNRSRE